MSSLECVVSSREADDEELVLHIRGELDLATEADLAECIGRALATAPHRLVIDMSGVTFFCSTGLRVLMTAHQRAEQLGCELVLRAVPVQAMRILETSGTASYFRRV